MDNILLPVRPANHDIPDPRCKLKFGARAEIYRDNERYSVFRSNEPRRA
jgi:hypothetical protein